MNLLNPYNLLGVTIDTDIVTLKKNYYHLALICHPDKGGNSKDMDVIHKAYKYVENQIKNIKNKTYEELENEFETFCRNQIETKIPTFYHIYKECHDWLDKFNKEFENLDRKEADYLLFSEGYGNLMDKTIKNTEYEDIETNNNKNIFDKELITYNEPKSYPDTISNTYRLDIKNIKDFSQCDGNLNMSDYFHAFCNPEKLDIPKDNNIIEAFENELSNRNLSI